MNWPDELLDRSIKDLIRTDVKIVDVDAPASRAVAEFGASPGGTVLVKGKDGRLTGLITAEDLGKFDSGKPETANDLATNKRIIAVRESAKLGQMLRIMNGDNARGETLNHLPVVDDDNKPIGVIDRAFLTQKLKSMRFPRMVADNLSY